MPVLTPSTTAIPTSRAQLRTQTSKPPRLDLWTKTSVEPLRLRRAPLLAAALCFALGEVLARHWQPPVVLLITLLSLVALTWPGLRDTAKSGVFAVAAVWIVTGLWCAEIQTAPPTQHALLTYADGLSRTVRGRVVRLRALPAMALDENADADPTLYLERDPAQQTNILSIDLAVDSIEQLTPDVSWMEPVTGGIRLTFAGEAPALRCGDLIEAPVRLKVPERYHDPGAWQYADYLLDQGIAAHANVKAAKLHPLGHAAHWDRLDLQCRIHAAQAWAANRVLAYVSSSANTSLPQVLRLTPDDAGMVNAMLFGDRSRLNHNLRLGFERTGSFHLFVVSGMHVALLAGGAFWMMRRLRLGEWTASLLTIALTAVYAVFTGFGAPVQRALLMTTIFLLARLLSRERSVLNALGAAALGVLVWSPRSLFEASFQMTFLVIVAIGGIAVPLGERSFLPYAHAARKLDDRWLDVAMPPRLAQLRVMLRLWGESLGLRALPATLLRWSLWAVELALVGLVAEAVMVLPMALYFHRATIFALPANMLSIPLVAVLAPMAILTFVASLLSPWLAFIPGAATALLLHGIVAVIHRIGHIGAADTRIPGPALWIALAAMAAWFFCCWAVRRSGRWAVAAVAVLPLAAAAILWPEPAVTSPGQLEVTAIDVGQGDSLLVVGPTGQTMLLDAGGPTGAVKETADATSRFDIGEEVVSPYLWSRHLRRLDVLALSHAHSDHMGGMAAVLRSFHPRELWVSVDPTSVAYQSLLQEAAALGVTVRHLHAGDTLPWAGTEVSVLAPEPSYSNRAAPGNNDSLVLHLQYGKASGLLEGDAEAPSERAMLAANRLDPVTLLKVGHHGSRTSSTEDFLNGVAPRDAVISVGKDNTFGHPRYEVIQRFAEAGTHLYRTDEFGLTTFLLSRDGTIHEVLSGASAP